MRDHLQDFHHDAIVNPETHHERSDVNVRALLWFCVIFVVFSAVTHLALWLMFRFFVQLERGNVRPQLTELARPASASIPTDPRLQPFPSRDQRGSVVDPTRNTPVTDMDVMLADQNGKLSTYGYVDRGKGVVRIPIEEAKKIALQRNLFPVNTGATMPAATMPAGDSRAATTEASQPAPAATGVQP